MRDPGIRRPSPTRLVALLLLGLVVAAPAGAQTARTVRVQSAAAGGQATFAILLPSDYETSGKRYPVLYLLHGGAQNHTAYPARGWFVKEAAGRGMIVVMPHTPQSLYAGRGGAAAPIDAFLATDLVDHVDATWRTIPSREARAIAGLSLGGYGALTVGLRHPDRFGTVGAFSGAFNDPRGAAAAAAIAAVTPGAAPFVYLACGRADQIVDTNRAVAAQLERRGIAHEYREVPGGHTWEVWDPQTLAFFDVLTSRPGWRAR